MQQVQACHFLWITLCVLGGASSCGPSLVQGAHTKQNELEKVASLHLLQYLCYLQPKPCGGGAPWCASAPGSRLKWRRWQSGSSLVGTGGGKRLGGRDKTKNCSGVGEGSGSLAMGIREGGGDATTPPPPSLSSSATALIALPKGQAWTEQMCCSCRTGK